MSLARNTRKLKRRHRPPAELLLVPMIDIFTVLVTFLLMTAVFSRTVILELKLPQPSNQLDLPKDLQLEVIVRKDTLTIADRNSGPLRTLPNVATGYDLQGLTDYLQFVKSHYQDKLQASVLLEPAIAYDTLVQIMDRVRVAQISAGLQTVQYELFPDISIGDAPTEGAAP
jgi:biopolymer transport protein ExbD